MMVVQQVTASVSAAAAQVSSQVTSGVSEAVAGVSARVSVASARVPGAGLPAPCAQQPPGTEALGTVLNWVFWGALFISLMMLIYSGVQVVVAHRREEPVEMAGGFIKVIVGVAIICGASGIMNMLITGKTC